MEEEFTMAEINWAIDEANSDSAPGPDRIPVKVLQVLLKVPAAKEALGKFFNTCFLRGKLPNEWSKSEIFVLFKGKGSPQNPDCYRGISLLNGIFKFFERILYRRVQCWAEKAGLLGDDQYGFRANRSCAQAFFIVRNFLEYSFRVSKRRAFLILVDLKKAFPSVPRKKLLLHLQSLGMGPVMLSAIANTLSSNSCRLRFGNVLSEEFFVNVGVREGGTLSPLLFILYFSGVFLEVGSLFSAHEPFQNLCFVCTK